MGAGGARMVIQITSSSESLFSEVLLNCLPWLVRLCLQSTVSYSAEPLSAEAQSWDDTRRQANVLMGWRRTGQDAALLDELLRFLVMLTKQTGRCHVVMATSEYGYQEWLSQGNRGQTTHVHWAMSV